jgi:hypothetical protein
MRFGWRNGRVGALVVLVAVCVAAGSTFAAGAAMSARDSVACAATTNVGTLRALQGVHVPSAHGSVWALVQGQVPAKVGHSLKVVWRVTGSGPLHVTFTSPSGRPKTLDFGPDPHGASTFRHPGDEWGTGFGFDAPGCWKIRVARAGARATVGITVSGSTTTSATACPPGQVPSPVGPPPKCVAAKGPT